MDCDEREKYFNPVRRPIESLSEFPTVAKVQNKNQIAKWKRAKHLYRYWKHRNEANLESISTSSKRNQSEIIRRRIAATEPQPEPEPELEPEARTQDRAAA